MEYLVIKDHNIDQLILKCFSKSVCIYMYVCVYILSTCIYVYIQIHLFTYTDTAHNICTKKGNVAKM